MSRMQFPQHNPSPAAGSTSVGGHFGMCINFKGSILRCQNEKMRYDATLKGTILHKSVHC